MKSFLLSFSLLLSLIFLILILLAYTIFAQNTNVTQLLIKPKDNFPEKSFQSLLSLHKVKQVNVITQINVRVIQVINSRLTNAIIGLRQNTNIEFIEIDSKIHPANLELRLKINKLEEKYEQNFASLNQNFVYNVTESSSNALNKLIVFWTEQNNLISNINVLKIQLKNLK